jgi:hypothetical protein
VFGEKKKIWKGQKGENLKKGGRKRKVNAKLQVKNVK